MLRRSCRIGTALLRDFYTHQRYINYQGVKYFIQTAVKKVLFYMVKGHLFYNYSASFTT